LLERKIDFPILHNAENTGKEAVKYGLKTLGLLGNIPTMTGDFIQSILEDQFTIKTIIPEEEYQDQAHNFISKELTQGFFSSEAKTFFLNQMCLLQNKGA
jgi:aspartate racemase